MKIKFVAVMLLLTPWMRCEETANGKCEEGKDEYCALCKSKACTSCYGSYVSSGQCMAPTTALDNCLAYSSATACSTCEPKYNLDSGKCTASTVENCLVASGTDCLSCDGLHDATDDKKCSGTACTVENCVSCKKESDVEMCYGCAAEYELASDKKSCTKVEGDYAGCTTNTKCVACAYGYYVSTADGVDPMKCTKSTRYGSISVMGTVVMTIMTFLNF